MGDFKDSVEKYVESNGGEIRSSRISQTQLQTLGKSYLGRFDFGKMYTFQYFTVKEKMYDTFPIVLSLGPSDQDHELGLNLHYMPFEIRVEFLDRIWDSFSYFIKKNTESSLFGRPVQQYPLIEFNWENLKMAYSRYINLKYIVRQYKLDSMRNMRILGNEDWHVAAANDENNFMGTTISVAQDHYYDSSLLQL